MRGREGRKGVSCYYDHCQGQARAAEPLPHRRHHAEDEVRARRQVWLVQEVGGGGAGLTCSGCGGPEHLCLVALCVLCVCPADGQTMRCGVSTTLRRVWMLFLEQ